MSGMPPAGRKVTRLTALGSWSDVVAKVAARTSVAKMATPSSQAVQAERTSGSAIGAAETSGGGANAPESMSAIDLSVSAMAWRA
jgi:hypothetical protein